MIKEGSTISLPLLLKEKGSQLMLDLLLKWRVSNLPILIYQQR